MLDRYSVKRLYKCTDAPGKRQAVVLPGRSQIEVPVVGTQQVRQAAVALLQNGRRALRGRTGQRSWRIWTLLLQKDDVKMLCSCFRRLMQIARTPRP